MKEILDSISAKAFAMNKNVFAKKISNDTYLVYIESDKYFVKNSKEVLKIAKKYAKDKYCFKFLGEKILDAIESI